MDLDGSTVTFLDDEPAKTLSSRQMALVRKRPIQSVDDLTSDFKITWRKPYRGGPEYQFKAVVKYPIIGQVDPVTQGDKNAYNGEWRGGGTLLQDPRLPHVWGCPEYHGYSYSPAAREEDFERIKAFAKEWTEAKLKADEKTPLEVKPYELEIVRFEEPLHMAFLVAEFNYRIGSAEVKLSGMYRDRKR